MTDSPANLGRPKDPTSARSLGDHFGVSRMTGYRISVVHRVKKAFPETAMWSTNACVMLDRWLRDNYGSRRCWTPRGLKQYLKHSVDGRRALRAEMRRIAKQQAPRIRRIAEQKVAHDERLAAWRAAHYEEKACEGMHRIAGIAAYVAGTETELQRIYLKRATLL